MVTRAREVQRRADAVRVGDGMLDFAREPYLYAPVVEVVREADGVLRFTLANGRVDRELPGNVCDVLEVTR